MAWSIIGNAIILDLNWQYTDIIQGSYFKLQHSNSPNNTIYQIAQAEFNSDNTINIFDDRILAVAQEYDVLFFKQPECFANRRLAIRRLPNQLSLEDQLRNTLVPGIFKLSYAQPNYLASAPWTVQIYVSDTTIQGIDLSAINQQLTIIKTELDIINQKLSTTSSSATSSTKKILTYVSGGDTNGVFYWIGTQGNTQPYSNPAVSGLVTATASSTLNSNAVASNLTDRGTAIAHSANDPNAYFEYDIGPNYSLIMSSYSLKGRDDSGVHLPVDWKMEASKDSSSWIDVDIQVNNLTIQANAWTTFPIANQTTAYRYWRLQLTGVDSGGNYYLTLGEWEFYGTLIVTQ